jgi:hypothetical protein
VFITAFVRDLDGVARDVGAPLGVAGHLLDRDRHARHRLGGRRRLLRLRLGGADEVPRRALGLLRGGIDENGRIVDRRDELAQRFDRIVDGVGDRAGDVLGNGGLHRQVAVGEARKLVEQAQDGLLIALVLLGLLLGSAAEVPAAVVDEHHQSRNGEGGEHQQQR